MAKRNRKRARISPSALNVLLAVGLGLAYWAGFPPTVLVLAGIGLTFAILGGIVRDYISMGPIAWIAFVVVFGGLLMFAMQLDATATPSSIVNGNCVGIFCWVGF